MDEVMQALGGFLVQALVAREPVMRPLATARVNQTVAILTIDKRELRSRHHAAVAISGAGDLAGALLNKRGTAVCTFVGIYDVFTDCVDVVGCGSAVRSCL